MEEKEMNLTCNHCKNEVTVQPEDINTSITEDGKIDLQIDCNICEELLGFHFIEVEQICLDED